MLLDFSQPPACILLREEKTGYVDGEFGEVNAVRLSGSRGQIFQPVYPIFAVLRAGTSLEFQNNVLDIKFN